MTKGFDILNASYFQIALLAVFIGWAVISFIFSFGGIGKGDGHLNGLDFIKKHSPSWWWTITKWLFPLMIILALIGCYFRL